MLAVTPEPLILTVVEPATKKVPDSPLVNDVPGAAAAMFMDVNVGAVPWTVNVTALLDPKPFKTVTLRGPGVAVLDTVNATFSEVELTPVGVPAVTPVPPTNTIVEPGLKFVPAKLTIIVAPCAAELGVAEVSVGKGPDDSVNLATNASVLPLLYVGS